MINSFSNINSISTPAPIKTSTRAQYLDCVAGVMIIWMIFKHCLNISEVSGCEPWLTKIEDLFCFFMSWFCFKSGMVHKYNSNLRIYFNKIFRRLLIPFIFWGIIGLIISSLILVLQKNVTLNALLISPIRIFVYSLSFSGNPALWFLSALAITKLIVWVFQRYKVNLWTLIIISFTISYTLSTFDFGKISKMFLGTVCLCMGFYTLGYKLKNISHNNHIYIISGIIFIVLFIVIPSNIKMYNNSLAFGYYPLSLLQDLCAIICINELFKKLPNSKWLEKVGQDSMILYVSHWLILEIVYFLFFDKVSNLSLLFLCLLSLLVYLPFMIWCFKKPKLKKFIGIN